MLEWRDVWVKGSFFLPFRTRGRYDKSGLWTSFSVKEGVKPEKRGFQPMRKKLGEKFGVVFSLTVVVTDTELFEGPFNVNAEGRSCLVSFVCFVNDSGKVHRCVD